MAVMKSTRTMRDAPAGVSINVMAVAGAKVRILDDTAPPWMKIELLDSDLDPKPKGWVSSQAVDPNADDLGPLDRKLFAAECVFQAKSFGSQAHYLMAVADMRTNVTDGANANGIDQGPFALSPIEWRLFGNLPEFEMNISASAIGNWTAQCLVFAAASAVMQRRVATLLGQQPSPALLALAQMIGSHAAVASTKAPDRPISDILTGVSSRDFAADAIEPARLPARYKEFLDGKTGAEAMEAIASVLQESLDETRPLIEEAGAAFTAFADELLQQIRPATGVVKAELVAAKTVVYTFADGSTLTKKNGSLAWRQNNPGNISNGDFAEANGAIAKGARFAIFPTEATGLKAIVALLTGPSYRDRTMAGAMERYAPPAENDTEAYIAFVTAKTGIARTTVLKTLTPTQLDGFARAIQEHEGWTPGVETKSAPLVALPGNATVHAAVQAARREWEHWGRSKPGNIGKTERSSGFADYVYENYFKAVVPNASASLKAQRVAAIRDDEYAWSAVAMSAFMKTAGFSSQQFRFSEGHSEYIRDAVAARKSGDTSATFWGFRTSEAAPAVGDLVGYARKQNGTVTMAEAQTFFDKTDSYFSHTDLVVEVRPGEIDVIGGNVSDSVTMKTLRTDHGTGFLIDTSNPWFVVMKHRLMA